MLSARTQLQQVRWASGVLVFEVLAREVGLQGNAGWGTNDFWDKDGPKCRNVRRAARMERLWWTTKKEKEEKHTKARREAFVVFVCVCLRRAMEKRCKREIGIEMEMHVHVVFRLVTRYIHYTTTLY